MEGTYPVIDRGQSAGTVTLRRCGLYYELFCRCKGAGAEMLRLMMVDEGRMSDLGVLIPERGLLELRKRIPVKYFRTAKPVFCLHCREDRMRSFLPIHTDQPFPYLHRLKDCAFEVRNGEKGIVLTDENNGEKVEI